MDVVDEARRLLEFGAAHVRPGEINVPFVLAGLNLEQRGKHGHSPICRRHCSSLERYTPVSAMPLHFARESASSGDAATPTDLKPDHSKKGRAPERSGLPR